MASTVNGAGDLLDAAVNATNGEICSGLRTREPGAGPDRACSEKDCPRSLRPLRALRRKGFRRSTEFDFGPFSEPRLSRKAWETRQSRLLNPPAGTRGFEKVGRPVTKLWESGQFWVLKMGKSRTRPRVPFATSCIDCQRKQERQGNSGGPETRLEAFGTAEDRSIGEGDDDAQIEVGRLELNFSE